MAAKNKPMAIRPATSAREYRAFELMVELPPSCIVFPVTDTDSLPHLRPGEFAVVDTTDMEPRNGEVYVIQWQSGARVLCQANIYRPGQLFYQDDRETWRVGSIRRGPTYEAILAAAKESASRGRIYVVPGWCDGPFNRDHLKSCLVGRVIGILGAASDGCMQDVSPSVPS